MTTSTHLKIYGILLCSLIAFVQMNAQIGDILWQEDFNDLDNWIIEQGNGNWGWGNGELQYYSPNNVRIDAIPGEPNNNALVITAKQETGSSIVDQWGNPLQYTSGRLNTKSTVSVKYGVIETRVRVPNLDLGGWPAVWLLGTSNYGWPRKGEIDMMEMGHGKWFRDLHDAHNGGNNQDNSTVNQMIGANAIFFSEDAINPQNPQGTASLSWDPDDNFCRPYYNYSNPFSDRFLTYRTYWDANSLRFTVIDEGTEHELYTEDFQIDSASYEFQNPFYFIANLAIGGAFTDAYNLGDPSTGQPISMTFPAEMYVDYIKVMEWNGQGEVHLGPPNGQFGTFGLYTDSTEVDDQLIPTISSEIYVWEGTLVPSNIPAYEGENVLSWQTNSTGWFGAGIMSIQPLNMFDFGAGNIKFRIKIPANVTFKIGIIDAWGNQNYVEFPANQTAYGLVRDGEWGQASIPVADIRGTLIDLRMLSYAFVILEEQGANCQFALDDIYWEGGPAASINDAYVRSLNLKNYPNPASQHTTISYTLPQSMEVELQVYDLNGQLVQTLVNERQNAGNHEIRWDTQSHPSGLYFYSLKTQKGIATQKCSIQR